MEQFKNFISATGVSGYRRVDSLGNPKGMGFSTKTEVKHFFPDAVFIADREELERQQEWFMTNVTND